MHLSGEAICIQYREKAGGAKGKLYNSPRGVPKSTSLLDYSSTTKKDFSKDFTPSKIPLTKEHDLFPGAASELLVLRTFAQ